MSKNILICVVGLILGFFFGFFVANQMGGTGASLANSNGATQTPPAARPLQAGETQLPPNHPTLEGMNAGGTRPTTSPEAEAARTSADRNPRDFEAQMKAADAFYQLGALERATEYLERALKLKPEDREVLVALGNTRYDAADYPAAAQFYERALAIKPDDADVRTDLGNTFFQRTPPDYDRTIAEYRRSVEIDPQHEKSWQNLAAAALRKRDKATAREAIERLAAVNPQNTALDALRRSAEALP